MMSLPFRYLYISKYLCAIEEMSLWELIAAISLLIQLIAALGCSFCLCSQRSLSKESHKAVSLQKRKTIKALPEILFLFWLYGAKISKK